jgi:predicted ferric reductase
MSGRLDVTGMLLICSFGAAIIISYFLKLFTYYFFLLFHRVIVIAVIVFTALHGAPLIYIGVGLWGLDLLIRSIVYLINKSKVKTVTAKRVSESIVELSFPKRNFKYRSGQYAFIIIPDISLWEPHPFSFSSSPHDEYAVMHIRVLGNWTQKLANSLTLPSQQLTVFIDGPYGSPSIDIESPNKSVFLLISGGIGVTPMRSIANDLLNQAARGRKIDQVIFYWAVRESSSIKSVINKNEWLSTFNKHFRKSDKTKILHRRIHLTKEDTALEHLPKFTGHSFAESVYQEKLELKRVFEELKAKTPKERSSQIGVLCCGPNSMIDQASSLSRQNGFDFHGEVFDL